MKRGLKTLLLFGLAFFVWAPLWMMVTGSFMGKDEIYEFVGPVLEQREGMAGWSLLPKYPTLRAYIELLIDSPKFFAMFWNTCYQVAPILIGQICIAVPAAWAFARYRFKGKKALFLLYITLMVLPFQVTMVSSYLVLLKLDIIDTHLSIILPNIFSAFPVFILTKFFRVIPESLLEAARLDGASEGYIFLSLGVPMGAPGIFSVVILGFIEYWNSIEQPLTFLAKRKDLWPLSLYLQGITTDRTSVAFVASAVMLAPALLLFLGGQKYLEQGIAASGIKG
ncbi:carbohydrate ABC transporter permease [Anaerocolumna cellulosilytica]|uniref:carbohydrate ABC transporter permease n=1 Tax=Anaerocolumna cellulosilytica TaxID=433286 RepID=UPI001620E560|nr:carbohydrate ABC transporter permease [Anaerocolumna cellulosilytica]